MWVVDLSRSLRDVKFLNFCFLFDSLRNRWFLLGHLDWLGIKLWLWCYDFWRSNVLRLWSDYLLLRWLSNILKLLLSCHLLLSWSDHLLWLGRGHLLLWCSCHLLLSLRSNSFWNLLLLNFDWNQTWIVLTLRRRWEHRRIVCWNVLLRFLDFGSEGLNLLLNAISDGVDQLLLFLLLAFLCRQATQWCCCDHICSYFWNWWDLR